MGSFAERLDLLNMAKLRSDLLAWFAGFCRKSTEEPKAISLNNKVGAEAPIQKASEDRLRRTDFASHIAKVLSELSLREGRVFAIRGSWGFGKSSLKDLIAEQLNSSNGADWVDFNPWQWGDSDAISRALFDQIANSLGGVYSKDAKSRAEALRRYSSILIGASTPLKKAGASKAAILTILTNTSVIAIAASINFDLPSARQAAFVLATLSIITSILGHFLAHFGRDRSKEPLSKVREALESQLRKLNRPLVVFVDDIDRLEPKQIQLLIRQVKTNANLPNIIFVLLFQPSIVEKALDPVANNDGRAFLEKIIQANFDLPLVPAATIHRLFGEELSDLVGTYATKENGFNQLRWGNALIGCIQPLVRNMRDSRRLLSSIAVHLPLHVESNVFEVNIIDFLILEALRVFEPTLHSALVHEKELLLQENRYSGDHRRETDKTTAMRLLDRVPEERRDIAQRTIGELFPQIKWAYGGTSYSSFGSHWLTNKQVCTPRYFPRYFELQTATGEISESRFIAFLESTTTQDRFNTAITSIENDGLILSLVARLEESVGQLPVDNAPVLLPGMFVIAQKLVGQENQDTFNLPWISTWRATHWFLKRIPESKRHTLILEALQQTKALSIAAMLIYLSDPTSYSNEDEFEPALDLSTIERMKEEWLQLIRIRAKDENALIVEPDLVSLLYRWRDYSGSFDEPRQWVEKAILTSQGFASMASRMMTQSSSHAEGDLVSIRHNNFSKQTIEEFIGIDRAKTRCDAINASEFPEHTEALQTLKKFLERW